MAINLIAMINLLNTARYSVSFLAQVEIGNTCKETWCLEKRTTKLRQTGETDQGNQHVWCTTK